MLRALDKWLPGYLASVMRRPAETQGAKHLMFCLADHFEPSQFQSANATEEIRNWVREYADVVKDFRDADGKPPQHTFFYPQEEYDENCLDCLSAFCGGGWGEVEVHLHHRNDTPGGFRDKLVNFRDTLRHKHSLLGSDKIGNARYGFIHGNWALCNSRPDGDWCGVNEELGILSETGCYADFTFPSAPSPTQPRMVNAIYYAEDKPGKARGCDRGRRAEVGTQDSGFRIQDSGCVSETVNRRNGKTARLGDGETATPETGDMNQKSRIPHPASRITNLESKGSPPDIHHSSFIIHNSTAPLLLITGPLALDWRRRKWGVLPRLENGAISGDNPPSAWRVDLWARQRIHVHGRSEWVFVKVYTHGCVAKNRAVIEGEPMRKAHERLLSEYNDGSKWVLHYVTAREMHNIVRAAEDGMPGSPGNYRDYEISPPPTG